MLLEDQNGCRTWRLETIPIIDEDAVKAINLPIHKLKWLDIIESEVSGGRGWASRVEAGNFSGVLPNSPLDPISLELFSKTIFGKLHISNGLCQIFSK